MVWWACMHASWFETKVRMHACMHPGQNIHVLIVLQPEKKKKGGTFWMCNVWYPDLKPKYFIYVNKYAFGMEPYSFRTYDNYKK